MAGPNEINEFAMLCCMLAVRIVPNGSFVMTLSQWLGMGAIGLVVAFIAFSFRQGNKVKPSGNDPTRRNDYT